MMNHSDEQNPVVQMQHITKLFPGVVALDDVSLTVHAGEVHALMGENGAGKSTLMKILAGIYTEYQGAIRLHDRPVRFSHPSQALKAGIAMIHQELNPIAAMTVAENIFIGREPTKVLPGLIDRRRMIRDAETLLQQMEIQLDPRETMARLSLSEMQMVEIVKALSYDARLVIMDEPTSALSDKEVAKLFQVIETLKVKGMAIIYISHKMDKVMQIADAVTVLRDGRHIETQAATQVTQAEIIKQMIGRELTDIFPAKENQLGDTVLEVNRITKVDAFSDVSFCVRQGEILGLAGLMGAGRTDIAEALFGIDPIDSGDIRIHGTQVDLCSPRQAIALGMGLVCEDRKQKGLNLKGSVTDNLSLVNLRALSQLGLFIQKGAERAKARQSMDDLRIKASGPDQVVQELSGGNQQKVVLGKWLMGDPQILILDEPTRGIDIQAKAEIYKLMVQLAEQGKAILFISSELPELMGLCDRIHTLYQGRITAEFQREAFDQERILSAALGTENTFGDDIC